MKDLENLTMFTSEKNLKYSLLMSAISKEEEIMKGNRYLREMMND